MDGDEAREHSFVVGVLIYQNQPPPSVSETSSPTNMRCCFSLFRVVLYCIVEQIQFPINISESSIAADVAGFATKLATPLKWSLDYSTITVL